MSLTVKSKPSSTHKIARSASHHKKNKHYLKTYWPYLPVLAILSLGIYLTLNWRTNVPSQSLSSYSYYNYIESSLALAALAIFLLRHAFAWHKVFVKSESFVIKHPYLDIALVSLAVISALLSHHNIPA